MKGIWKGESDEFGLINGKEYEIIGIDEDLDAYGVVDETGDSYCYPMELFEITREYPKPPVRRE